MNSDHLIAGIFHATKLIAKKHALFDTSRRYVSCPSVGGEFQKLGPQREGQRRLPKLKLLVSPFCFCFTRSVCHCFLCAGALREQIRSLCLADNRAILIRMFIFTTERQNSVSHVLILKAITKRRTHPLGTFLRVSIVFYSQVHCLCMQFSLTIASSPPGTTLIQTETNTAEDEISLPAHFLLLFL